MQCEYGVTVNMCHSDWRFCNLLQRVVAFGAFVASSLAIAQAQSTELTDLLNAPTQEIRAQIDRASAIVVRSLSPIGQEASRLSLSRFYRWVDGNCLENGAQGTRAQEVESCVRNQYVNYFARIPGSVYQVGDWTAYETGIFGLIWADDDLQGQDASRPFTWELQVIWPRIDSVNSPLSGDFSSALAEEVRALESGWATGGWSRYIEVRIAAINDCYISASVTGSTYSGGAHPYEDYRTFNWDRRTKRPIVLTTLLQANPASLNGALNLYKKRLGESATGVSDDSLQHLLQSGFLLMDSGIRIIDQEGRSRIERLPEVDIPWLELSPWLVPSVPCVRGTAKPLQK
jgi:hypothetical protein